ncbi:MAG: hypothetical protein OSB21_07545 [Myxococcota bacterium]|nr:hypothetical protein [Myxococcota bacterium]
MITLFGLLLAAQPLEAELGFSASLSNPAMAITMRARRGVSSGWEARLEWNPWVSFAGFEQLLAGTLNIGAGWYKRYFMNRVRFVASSGASVLLFDTPIDTKGTTGGFLSIEPALLSWPLRRGTLTIDPGSVHLIMPVLGGLPLIHRQFRHGIGWAMSW